MYVLNDNIFYVTLFIDMSPYDGILVMMETIAEKLKLEHFSRTAFIRLLDYVIDTIKPYRIVLASGKPTIRESVEIHPGHVFDIPLSGTKHSIYGRGKEIDELRMVPGEVFYTRPFVWKRPLWDCAHEMSSFVFNEQFIRLTYVDILTPPEPGMYPRSSCFYHTQLPPSEPIRKLLSVLELLEENGDSGGAAMEVMRGLFRLTREMLKEDIGQEFTQSQITFQRIDQYLRENFQANINRNHVAHVFKLHPGYISRLYLDNSNHTFSETLHSLRMEHAAILLKTTDLLVNEITDHCGYESLTFFTAAFKKYFGVPPARFRQQYLKEQYIEKA